MEGMTLILSWDGEMVYDCLKQAADNQYVVMSGDTDYMLTRWSDEEEDLLFHVYGRVYNNRTNEPEGEEIDLDLNLPLQVY
jgi:hypothetical protein